MAPLLYTSTIAEKLYSCDEEGAHVSWDSIASPRLSLLWAQEVKLALCPAHMPLPARKKKVEQTYYQFVVRTKEIVDLLRHIHFASLSVNRLS